MTGERMLTLLMLALVSFGLVYLGACTEAVAPTANVRTGKRVEVATVATTQANREVRFSGVLRSVRRARLGFTSSGRVISRPVRLGERVKPGQVLARREALELDNAVATALAQLAELEARRAQSERDAERTQRLVTAKAATSEELERSTAALDSLRAAEEAAAARLREARRRLDDAVLQAPFAGTITEVYYETDEYAQEGRPVVVLSGDGPIELEVELPESLIRRVSEGDSVTVDLPALDTSGVIGKVTSVARMAIGSGRLFPVVAELEELPEVMAGMTGELVLQLSTDDTLAIPVEAVVNPGGRRPAVFRLRGDVVERIEIEIEGLLGEQVTVRGPLDPGDEVVVGGQRGLLDGERVEVVR